MSSETVSSPVECPAVEVDDPRIKSSRSLGQRLRKINLPQVAFLVLCAACVVGFFVYPTFPNYDSYYSLLWGRELLEGHSPVFTGFRFPTEHPLAIALGLLFALFGDVGDRLWNAFTLASFLAVVWGIYRLGKGAFTPLIGFIAATLVVVRIDFIFLAARGYVDVPFMALLVWAAVLEQARPRRGTPVFVLLCAAGLLRPEAWVMAAAYWLWVAWKASWTQRFWYAVLAGLAGALWALVDFAFTGDPLFSFHYTSSLAEDLGRQRGISEIPSATFWFLVSILKFPVVMAGFGGLAIAAVASPKRMAAPVALFAMSLGTFVLMALAGSSIIPRYVMVPALALVIFAAVALGGFTLLRQGSWIRRGWMVGAAVAIVFGVVFTAGRVNLSRFEAELIFRGESHAQLRQLLSDPSVKAAAKCGPISLPNHKLVPEVRWLTGLSSSQVIARADKQRGREEAGVAIYATERTAIIRQAFTQPTDSALIQVPYKPFERIANTGFYAAYGSCKN